MAEDQKKTTNTQNQAERLLGCLPSTSVLTIPSNRFDVQASKSLILEVASSLVAEKSIFGDMGRKKFREIYNDKFPSLKEK